MFDIGGLELLVIAIVLIVVVGPKDLPKMLRTFGRVSGQMRRMAGDFRRQFDEALREAELDELRQTAEDVRKLDPRNDIRKAMNPIRSVGDEIRSSLKAATVAPEPKVPTSTQDAVPVAPEASNTAKASEGVGQAAESRSPGIANPSPSHLNGSAVSEVDGPVRSTSGGVQ